MVQILCIYYYPTIDGFPSPLEPRKIQSTVTGTCYYWARWISRFVSRPNGHNFDLFACLVRTFDIGRLHIRTKAAAYTRVQANARRLLREQLRPGPLHVGLWIFNVSKLRIWNLDTTGASFKGLLAFHGGPQPRLLQHHRVPGSSLHPIFENLAVVCYAERY